MGNSKLNLYYILLLFNRQLPMEICKYAYVEAVFSDSAVTNLLVFKQIVIDIFFKTNTYENNVKYVYLPCFQKGKVEFLITHDY